MKRQGSDFGQCLGMVRLDRFRIHAPPVLNVGWVQHTLGRVENVEVEMFLYAFIKNEIHLYRHIIE